MKLYDETYTLNNCNWSIKLTTDAGDNKKSSQHERPQPRSQSEGRKNLEKLSFDARIGIPGWEHGAGLWIWTSYKCNQLKPKSACASSSGTSLDIYKNYMKQLDDTLLQAYIESDFIVSQDIL